MQVDKLMGGLDGGKEAQATRHYEPSQKMNYFQTQQNCNQILQHVLDEYKY